jgi:hypothetical protein
LLGDEPIIIELFFMGLRGVIMGSIMGSQNIMGSDYGSNISVYRNYEYQRNHRKISVKRIETHSQGLSISSFYQIGLGVDI